MLDLTQHPLNRQWSDLRVLGSRPMSVLFVLPSTVAAIAAVRTDILDARSDG